jgi:hypothetical protein
LLGKMDINREGKKTKLELTIWKWLKI